jgi:plasmid stabilization system protein ParE
MNRRTFVRPEAQSNIREAAIWYEQRETGLGHRFTDEIRQSLKSITKTPRRFPIIENGVRRLLLHHFPFAVYFVVDRDSVVILAVLHQHRAPQTWASSRTDDKSYSS